MSARSLHRSSAAAGSARAGLEQAAERIAAAFAQAGLQPAGDTPGSWFQSFAARGGDPPREAVLKNVVGVIPGTGGNLDKDLLVIGAHYDHLGDGDPGCLPANRGRVHPGADDNASGVAVLLELARTLWKEDRPARTVVFVAFAGEEAGRLGSSHFVTAPAFPPGRTLAMVDLDTVGRLDGPQDPRARRCVRARVGAHPPRRRLSRRRRRPRWRPGTSTRATT